MEVATATPTNSGVPPFHDHDVREWSTLDSLTGVLERARIETDHWSANTSHSSHKYGKVVDSRARTDADGALRQRARRQLEVFQSQVPGGQLQVIKTHSVVSSSSSWTNGNSISGKRIGGGEFEGLQILSSPLDSSYQKSKAALSRSVARRPPTKSKNREDSSPSRLFANSNDSQLLASTNLQNVTRLCHQIHNNAVKNSFGKHSNGTASAEISNITKPNENDKAIPKNEEITNRNGHTNLSRTKSTSSEDFLINYPSDKSTRSIEDLEDLEQLQTWRRTSKIRRSLPHPKQEKTTPNKPIDLPQSSVSVRQIKEDFEKGRRLSTALRGNNIDLQALDQILQTISSSSSDKTSIAEEENDNKIDNPKSKRNSFVTVESLQAIKGRLRRTSTEQETSNNRDLEIDDGIDTEDNVFKNEEKMIDTSKIHTTQSRVRSYVFGMESALSKKSVIGTGSLESRSKLSNGTTNRNEDWYNRRKSYGFEPVQNQNNESMSSKKNMVESSTDSGICRSSEVIVVPSVIKNHRTNTEEYNTDNDNVRNRLDSSDSSYGNVRKITSLFDSVSNSNQKTNSFNLKKETDYNWNRKLNSDWGLSSGITIKIPIVSDSTWNEAPEREIKRHSIAVDETKYVDQRKSIDEARRTSLVINEAFLNSPLFENGDNDLSALKKSKKVEFCKTEVHFAAESGKVNIVETDEKPPPTQNFRRRRRNSNSMSYLNDFNRNGLPVIHFGENYPEKFVSTNGNHLDDNINSAEENENGSVLKAIGSHGTVTVNSDFNSFNVCDEERRDSSENESIKGILKNKIAKPKPYHLGEIPLNFNLLNDVNSWVTQKPERDPPLWKSTVTVSNTLYNNNNNNSDTRRKEENSQVLKTIDSNNQPDIIRDQLKRFVDNQDDDVIIRSSEAADRMKPYLSVAERIRNMEESRKIDNHKGYSTRVNIGDGKAIVVENNGIISSEYYGNVNGEEKKANKLYNYESEAVSTASGEPVHIKTEIRNRKYSPIVLRKHSIGIKTAELKSANASTKLSSPLLVGRSAVENTRNIQERKPETKTNGNTQHEENANSYEVKASEETSESTFIKNEKVLRQPNKSEMAYFGVKIPRQENIIRSNTFTRERPKTANYKRDAELPKVLSTSPIYENVSPIPHKPTRQFDSGILEELTKAADEILQAVKDYSEEEIRKQITEEETKTELSTITENKSWKHTEEKSINKPIDRPCKSKLRNTSSNSSLEASPKEAKPTHRYIANTKASADKIKTKASTNDSTGLKASTKARRLQRASSREALLQSHGSSSEDLAPNEAPLRKPRLVRKTKTTQLTISNGLDVNRKGTVATNAKKKTDVATKTKNEERLPGALPEIRHKTAVSTIRGTTDKMIRDRSKQRGEEKKKTAYNENTKTSPTLALVSPQRSKRETVTHRLATANIKRYRPDKH